MNILERQFFLLGCDVNDNHSDVSIKGAFYDVKNAVADNETEVCTDWNDKIQLLPVVLAHNDA